MLVRSYRMAARLKQREVAEAIGMQPSSYGNVESVSHKAMSLDRVHRLASYFKLDGAAVAELVAAWHELPASEYSQRQAKSYAERRAYRSKARNFDRFKAALLEMTTLNIVNAASPDDVCTCEPPDLFAAGQPEPCEVCNALQLLGLSGYTNRDDVIAKLARLQEVMT